MNRERIQYIRNLQQNILAYLYVKQAELIKEAMEQIAITNQLLLNSATNTFLHEGIMYTAGDPSQATYGMNREPIYLPNKILHPSLRDVCKQTLAKKFEAKAEEATILNYFANIIMYVKHYKDLYTLLPSPLHSFISTIHKDLFTIGNEMTKEEILDFTKNNREGIKCLNSLFMTRLLLTK